MGIGPANHPHRHTSRRAIYVAMLVLFCLAPIASLGCSEKKHYKLLSFFFDGVPDPNAPRGGPGGSGSQANLVRYTHKAFADEKCGACHGNDPGTMLGTALTSEKCLQCHENIPKQYPWMHGPVAAVNCLWCHAPHEAYEPKLLRSSPPALCTQCHETVLLSTKIPQHVDLKTNCLDCHMGHGGPHRYMLRDRAAQPTTLPTTGPVVSR